jgi:hypothetical protein
MENYENSGNLYDSIPTSNPLSTGLDKKVDVVAREYMMRVGFENVRCGCEGG